MYSQRWYEGRVAGYIDRMQGQTNKLDADYRDGYRAGRIAAGRTLHRKLEFLYEVLRSEEVL